MKGHVVDMLPKIAAGIFCVGAVCIWSVALRAQNAATPQQTIRDGVFTLAQAERGREAYESSSCVRCHLATLEGREQGGGGNGGAPLKGLRFIQDFGESRLSKLVNTIRIDEPKESPGTLSEQAALDIAAYILSKNEYPAGQIELTSETAAAIWIPGPPGATGVPNYTLVSSFGCLYQDPSNSWLLRNAAAVTPLVPAQVDPAVTSATLASTERTNTFRLLNAFNHKAVAYANQGVRVTGYLVRLGAEIRISLTSLQAEAAACKLEAQTPSASQTIWSSVFSEFQARRGEKLASISCGGCHGPDLDGGDSGPRLVGSTFLSNWTGKTIWDLFDWINKEMPADSPGSLSRESTANVIAYILELNKAEPGAKDLSIEQAVLSQIRIIEPQQK
jgi:mono/diheme cytochrome c family protein